MARYDLAFVDSIVANPTVRLDLRGPAWNLRDTTTFGLPELRRAVASTLLADGDAYPAAAYGNRTITLVLQVNGADDDARAAAMQTLHRELDRPTNILKYRPGTSAPVFFRTFRCGPDAIRWDPFVKEWTVSIPAEPFALGLKETLGPYTVYNDPWAVGATLLANGTLESGVSPWTGQNGTVAQSSTVAWAGTYSLRLTPTGGLSPVAARSEYVPVVAGSTYRAQMMVYAAGGWSDVACAIDWYDSGSSLISTAGAGGPALAAATWEARTQDAVAPAGAVTARVRARMGGTPTPADVMYVDEVSIGERGGVGGNAMWVDLTGVKGDVETPLRITVPQAGGLLDGDMSVLAVRRRGTPSQAPFVLQAESMAQSNDTSTQAGAEDVSGVGSAWSRTTFATVTALTYRLSLEWPTTAGVDMRGRYRVFARLRTTVFDDEIDVWLRWGLSGLASAGADIVAVGWDGSAGSTGWRLADLGLMSMPAGGSPDVDGLSGVPLTATGQTIIVYAGRNTGTGSLDWDYLILVPADDRLSIVSWGGIDLAGGSVVIDATTETVYGVNSDGVPYGGGTPPSCTGWIYASPGVTNRLYWLRTAGRHVTDVISTVSTSLTIEYWPRYLYARPVSS